MHLHDNVDEDANQPDADDEYVEGYAPQTAVVEDDDYFSYAAPTDAADRLRGLVIYLAGNLVDDPQAVEVEARQRGGSVFVSLRVPEEELGKVIGRGGRIARAMRTALMICGSRSNVRASLDIED